MQAVADELANGSSVVLFPEGTTSDGQGILPFHKTFFQAAIDAGTIVQPVVMRYCRNGRLDEHAPYINKISFLSHFLQFTRHLGATVNITCLPPLEPGDSDRKTLSENARRVIVNAHAELHDSSQATSEHIEPGDCLGYERGA
jgi:1-acyl-sn-glycerol-3-phosphate acyltransferase